MLFVHVFRAFFEPFDGLEKFPGGEVNERVLCTRANRGINFLIELSKRFCIQVYKSFQLGGFFSHDGRVLYRQRICGAETRNEANIQHAISRL